MSRRRVVVTGLGAVTPVAEGAEATFAALVAGRSGAGPITIFDASAYGVRFACEVKAWEPSRYLSSKRLKELDRFSELALVAANMAVADAELTLTERSSSAPGASSA